MSKIKVISNVTGACAIVTNVKMHKCLKNRPRLHEGKLKKRKGKKKKPHVKITKHLVANLTANKGIKHTN